MSLLERLQNRIHGEATWPPPEQREHWEKVQDYRRRFVNDAEKLLPYATDFNRSKDAQRLYTPVGLAREIASFSAAMLFSAPPEITFEKDEDLLDEVVRGNSIESRFHAAAEQVAVEGRGALRVHVDETVSDVVQVHYIPEDKVLWEERHGDIVIGGAVVLERKPNPRSTEVFRLIEEHGVDNGGGYITRTLYRGTNVRLGQEVELGALPEFKDLEAEVDTGLDSPTLYRWNNKPSGASDIAGIEALLDRLDEAESLLLDKGRKSIPITFVDRKLSDENGHVDLSGVVLLEGTSMSNLAPEMGATVSRLAETVQPGLQSQDHIAWIEHLRETALQMAGYSLASWGLDQGGSADSGKALRLRQSRTLLTKAAKEREATEAITNALACAMAWQDGGKKVSEYRPEVKLGDGMPRDELEEAQVVNLWESAEAISLEEKIRARRPDWDEQTVSEEVARIRAQTKGPEPRVPELNEDTLFGGLEDGRG